MGKQPEMVSVTPASTRLKEDTVVASHIELCKAVFMPRQLNHEVLEQTLDASA